MGRARLLVVLLVGSVVLAAGGAYAVVRHQQRLPTVTCRQLLDPRAAQALPATVVDDLASPRFHLDVGGLSLPPAARVDQARHALQQDDWPQPDALVCALPTPDSLLFVRQAEVPLEHCYGPTGQCAGPSERRTCAAVFSFVTRGTHWGRSERCPALG